MFGKKNKYGNQKSYLELVNDNLAEQNKKGYMDANVENELLKIFSDNNYVIGVHKTGYTPINNDVINDIFLNGLYSNGHILSGGIAGRYDIERTVNFYDNFVELSVNIKQCKGYKNSNGCIILKIPKNMKKSNQLFYVDSDNQVIILPEYIYGYIPVNDMRVTNIFHNPNYKDEHVFLSTKYNILFKAYQDTLLKYGYNQAVSAIYNFICNNDVSYFSGLENRNGIKEYIKKDEIIKILSYGLNADTSDLNDLINMFNMNVQNSFEKKENTK